MCSLEPHPSEDAAPFYGIQKIFGAPFLQDDLFFSILEQRGKIMDSKIQELILQLSKTHHLPETAYACLIRGCSEEASAYAAQLAVPLRRQIYGTDVYVRGLIEISNICRNDCLYCGIRRSNKTCVRYRLSPQEILECCEEGYSLGFRTFVLQGGEDGFYTDELLCELLRAIKAQFPDCAVTLSLGERDHESYKRLFDAGADRYLLRHETADACHYQKLHPTDMSFDHRIGCLQDLKEIGYQVGCGFMVGSPFQTPETLAKDLKFIETFQPAMCGIGPFVPHHATPFASYPQGSLELTLYLLSLIRLIAPDILLPATTALGTIHPMGREKGILAGANVVMPNLSPVAQRKKYELYDNKICTGEESAQCRSCLSSRMHSIGYEVVVSRGDQKKLTATISSTDQSSACFTKRRKNMAVYNPKSLKAEEFINHGEILDTLRYAEENKNNVELIDALLEKARPKKAGNGIHCEGLTHREASVLLACDIPEKIQKMYEVAEEIKLAFYGNRIVMFAPLYLSNYCINGCLYCPYHLKNKHIGRKKLTQEEVCQEVIALQDMGHKRLAIEAGEDPKNSPIEYILECIKTIYGIHHKNGAIRRVNVNIAATTVEEYRMLKEAGIGTYILFQETYNKESYLQLHPTGPKHNYDYHTEAMDRAMEGGIDDVGLGVLFGLELYKYEFAGLLMHAEHLEAVHGVGPHTISVPRVKHADDIDPSAFDNSIPDEMFTKIIACIRLAVPYTGMIISTRESEEVRAKALKVGISQISGASRTSVGGYTQEERPHDTEQFDVSDQRSLDEVVRWLMEMGFIPSFCTACYREGRTGDRFMSLCKSGQIQNCCHPNALMTLTEYLIDYASEETKQIGFALIEKELEKIPREKTREIARKHIEEIKTSNSRDFRF